MQMQWYLCQISNYPEYRVGDFKKTDNLSVRHPTIFVDTVDAMVMGDMVVDRNEEGEGGWYVWIPIIPRVGDTLQFAGWQAQVSKVVLETDWFSDKGIQEGQKLAARISIRDDVVQGLTDAHFSIESLNNDWLHKWENFAARGHDLQYFAWGLKHKFYEMERSSYTGELTYYRWHTRVRPHTGDIIQIHDKRWYVRSVELASANNSVDGWLSLEALD